MKLLTIANAKTIKGEARGYLTGILYLAPANESRVMNTCPCSTAECRKACLFTAGRGQFDSVRSARIRKTRWLYDDRESFEQQLADDVSSLIAKAKRLDMVPCVRVNGTSDLPQLALRLARKFPSVQHYDYSKVPRCETRITNNYHLTYSYSGYNLGECLRVLKHSVNVAVVFDTKRGEPLPKTWNGYRVIDGDLSDLRFLDPKGVIVGLRAKGKARKIRKEREQRPACHVPANQFVQIAGAL
jgi:hypothetical protein